MVSILLTYNQFCDKRDEILLRPVPKDFAEHLSAVNEGVYRDFIEWMQGVRQHYNRVPDHEMDVVYRQELSLRHYTLPAVHRQAKIMVYKRNGVQTFYSDHLCRAYNTLYTFYYFYIYQGGL